MREVRTEDVADQAGLHLLTGIPHGPVSPPGRLTIPLAGSNGWTMQEVRARIPVEAGIIQFGTFLNGHGRAELRNAELTFEA